MQILSKKTPLDFKNYVTIILSFLKSNIVILRFMLKNNLNSKIFCKKDEFELEIVILFLPLF